MDPLFTIVANITQILSFLWLIFLGSKTLFDLKKQKNFLFKPLFLTNIFQAFIILFLSSAFLFSHPTNPLIAITTPAPARPVPNHYTILQKPDLPLPIPCELASKVQWNEKQRLAFSCPERKEDTLHTFHAAVKDELYNPSLFGKEKGKKRQKAYFE